MSFLAPSSFLFFFALAATDITTTHATPHPIAALGDANDITPPSVANSPRLELQPRVAHPQANSLAWKDGGDLIPDGFVIEGDASEAQEMGPSLWDKSTAGSSDRKEKMLARRSPAPVTDSAAGAATSAKLGDHCDPTLLRPCAGQYTRCVNSRPMLSMSDNYVCVDFRGTKGSPCEGPELPQVCGDGLFCQRKSFWYVKKYCLPY